ncbi:MAG: PepSY domain-containing protein [Anaerolineae bacterium]|nr:PepSY domain-containing protein [Anaerolineae bacterium]
MMLSKRTTRFSTVILAICALALMILVPGAAAQDAQSVELVGVIEALTVSSITVNQQVVDIAGAELNTPLVVGALVQVEGAWRADGTIAAREVNAPGVGVQAGEAELVGTLESISGTLLVVNGQTIDATGAQIRGTLAIGQPVRIHAVAAGPFLWRAREVEQVQARVGDPSPSPIAGEFEIVGTLDSIDGATVVVSGQIISLSGAEIKDPLVVGTLVKAHVSNIAGVLTAREIELALPGQAGDDNSNANANSNDNSDDDNGNANDNVAVGSLPATSLQQAIAEVLRVYPTARIRSVELTTRFGGTLVWEIETNNRIEVIVDAQTGAILVIDRPGRGGADDNGNGNANDNGSDDNSNGNSNDNSNDNGSDDNSNGNSNDNSNDNGSDDGSNDNSGGDDGMGGMG